MPTFTLEDVKKREKPSWTLENAGKKAPTLTREIVEKTIDDVVNTYGGDANLAALLKETAAQESHFGKLAPKNVMQLTPIHLKEMRKLKYKPMLAVLGAKYTPEGNLDAKDLRTNVILALMRYQTAKGFKGASAKQSERAQQWKNFYNTKKGAGTVGKYKQTLKDLGLFEEEKNWSFLNPLAVKEAYAEERPSFTLEPVEPSKKQFGFTLEDVKPAKKSAIINEAKKFFSQKQIAMEAGRRAIPHYLKWETETLQPALKYFFTRDIEKAKKLLAEAGYPNGFEVELMTTDTDRRKNEAVKIQADLAKIGIKVNVVIMKGSQMYPKYRKQGHQMVLAGWGSDYPDPDNYAKPFADYTVHQLAWRNMWYDDYASLLAKKGGIENDPVKRCQIYEDLTEYWFLNSPFAILYQNVSYFAHRSELRNFEEAFNGYSQRTPDFTKLYKE